MKTTEITVCLGKSCRANFSEDVLKQVEKSAKCGLFDSSDDGLFELESATCMQNCQFGPSVRFNNKMLSQMSPKEAKIVIKAIRDNDEEFLASVFEDAKVLG
jgi:NADH-quinone oxidoreductase subunit E